MENKIYCVDCDVFFDKIQTGFVTEIQHNTFIRGDLFKCPNCGKEILSDFGVPYSPNYKVVPVFRARAAK